MLSNRSFLTTDEASVFHLWQTMLSATWPISLQEFQRILFQNQDPSHYLIATNNNQIIGFIAIAANQNTKTAQIKLLLVDPAHSFDQIGHDLLSAALPELRDIGITTLKFGSGVSQYFWPGIPKNLPTLINFFQNEDWEFPEKSIDMIGELKDYQTPDFVYQRLESNDITIDFIEPKEIPQLLDFEKQHFPEWLQYFQETAEQGRLMEILVAKTPENQIVGSVLVGKKPNFQWQELLGDNVGTVGALGVSEDMRGKGVGLALAAKATETLQAQNIQTCYLGWTWLEEWYGKLGYRVWREYQMASKAL